MRKLLSLFTALLFVGSMWGALTNTYTKITSATSLDESAEYVIGNVDDYGCPTKTDGTTINTTEANWVRWRAKNVTGGFYLYNGSIYLKVPASNAWGSGTSSDCSVLTTNNEGIVSGNDGTNDRILVKNSSNAYLRWYKSGQTKAYLYKVTSPSATLTSLSITGDLSDKSYEEGQDLDFSGLTVTGTYSDSSSDDVTDDVEWSFTPALAVGTTSYTVTATIGNISANITITNITVTEHAVHPGTYDIVPGNALWGTSYNGTVNNPPTTLSASKNDVTVTFNRNTSGNMYIKNDQTRAYNGYTVVLSVPAGYEITDIEFTGSTWVEPTVVVGEMTGDKTWEGAAKSVTFTFSGTSYVQNINITYIVAKPALVLSANALDFGSVVKDALVAAQTFTLSGANLEDAHAVTLDAPSGFTVSPTSITPSSGSISAQTITVTPITSAVGAFDGNLTISSDDLDADSIVALSLTVTAAEVNVTSVELDKTSISIEEGETETLIATVLPVDATNKAVTWESSDEDIATVADGIVTAVAKGSATITCKSVADPTKLATCEVTVTGPDVVLDFTTNEGWSFPTSKTTDEDTFTNGDYSVTAGGGYYFVSDDHCLLVGKQNAYLTLPIFTDKAISKIITLAESTGSKDVVFNIYQGATEVSTEVTSCKVDQTFNISPKKVNTEHTLKIKSAHNARFSKILIYYGEPDPIYAVNCAAAENGSVSADKASACAGETVTLTLTPDAGYKVASVAVNGGDPLAVTENQATFEMPAAIANVVATFSVATALDNTEVDAKAVKVLRNGILLIEKNGHTYNAMGQLVK